ncbi:NADPH--cytochrome P450 reductase-like [Rosa rugosa]|uniref:NADPH--cytochrome P450 reductase-like n=1 Tax=Rosa rugosa TaxID=74645 RepID=UPI002B404314|nr:NADPH--cytochrome P450 reductase-like [Rosa rugosa]
MAVVIAMTSIELIIGFLVVLWWRSSDKTSRVVKQLAVPLKEEEDEFEVASGKTRVTIFSGTQTGTAEEGAMTTCIPAGTGKLHFRVRDFNARGCRKASWVTFSELSRSCGVSKCLQIQRCNSS